MSISTASALTGLSDTPISLQINWLLKDARIQRSYEREDAACGHRGILVKSAPSPRYVLRSIQRDLASLRRWRNAEVSK